ncbi:MAG: hypothetical protein PVF17_07110 [Ignavibacteria bacterium]
MLIIPKLEILVALIQILILYKFIKIVVIKLHNQGEFNLFYLVLIFYEISAIFNLILLSIGTPANVVVFVSTITFQILVAIFFTIFREDSKRLAFQVKVAK